MFCRDRRTTATRLTTVSASTTSADEAERDVHGALVVERTRRKVGPQHHATLPQRDDDARYAFAQQDADRRGERVEQPRDWR